MCFMQIYAAEETVLATVSLAYNAGWLNKASRLDNWCSDTVRLQSVASRLPLAAVIIHRDSGVTTVQAVLIMTDCKT